MDKRIYEVVFIVQPTMAEDDLNALSTSLQQIVTSQGGEIIKAESMGKRHLAYPIGRVTEGQYMLFEIAGAGSEIAELERRMRVNDQVVRYITVRVDEDRRRADKFLAKRMRKASKRPGFVPATEAAAE